MSLVFVNNQIDESAAEEEGGNRRLKSHDRTKGESSVREEKRSYTISIDSWAMAFNLNLSIHFPRYPPPPASIHRFSLFIFTPNVTKRSIISVLESIVQKE